MAGFAARPDRLECIGLTPQNGRPSIGQWPPIPGVSFPFRRKPETQPAVVLHALYYTLA